jgi:hypothetical protein
MDGCDGNAAAGGGYATIQSPAGTALTTRTVAALRDGLQGVDDSANSRTNIDRMIEPTATIFEDDFIGGRGTNQPGLIWGIQCNFGACPSGSIVTSTANHPGVWEAHATTTTAGDAAQLLPATGFDPGVIAPLNVAGWDFVWIFQLDHTNNEKFFIGLADSATCGVSSNAVGISYDTTASDVKFTFNVKVAGTPTTSITNSVNADTGWHKLRARSTTAGSILFSIDGGTETTIATAPTVAVYPMAVVCNATGTTTAVKVLVDYFGFRMRGLSR